MSRSFSWFEWQKAAEAAPRGWAEHPIHIVVNVNICVHEVYIRHMSHAILSLRRNFCVTTDRYAVFIISLA